MTDPSDNHTTEEKIADLAREIWESEGRPRGREQEHWFAAKQRLEARGSGRGSAGPADEPGDGVSPSATPFVQSSLGDEKAQPAGGGGADAGAEAADHTFVRPAGRKQMDDPPSTWSKTDEEVDESFPASDPPGNY